MPAPAPDRAALPHSSQRGNDMAFTKIDFFGPARPIRLRFRLRRSSGLALHTTIVAKTVWHAKQELLKRYGAALDAGAVEVIDA